MQLHRNTGCYVLIIGYLKEIPELRMDLEGEFMSTLHVMRIKIIQNQSSEFIDDSVFSYRVFVTGNPALRVRQFGFPGVYLWIEGDLQSSGEIVAEKIGFLDSPTSCEPENTFSFAHTNGLKSHKHFHPICIKNNGYEQNSRFSLN